MVNNRKKYLKLIYSTVLLAPFCSFILVSYTYNKHTKTFEKNVLEKTNKNSFKTLSLTTIKQKPEDNNFDMPAPNYYEEKGYKLNQNVVRIINGKQIQLELLDSLGQKVLDVEWFVKTKYPYDKVYSKDSKDFDKNYFFKFPTNGLIIGQENKKDNQQAEVWAKHNNHYYRAVIKGVHDDALDSRFEDEINKKSDEVIKKLGLENLSDVEKVIQVNDWILKNVSYQDSSIDQTLYSAIINGKTVCTGYGKIFKHFMDKLGIPCNLVQGNVPRSVRLPEKHLWDLVEIDGEKYHVDPTWNDSGQNTNFYLFLGDDDFSTYQHYRDYLKTNNTGVKYKVYLHYKRNEFADSLDKVEEIVKFKYEKFPLSSLSASKTTKTTLRFITTKDLNTEEIRQRIESSIPGLKATLTYRKEYKSNFYQNEFILEIPPVKPGSITKINISKIESVKAKDNEPMDHIKITLENKIDLKKYNFSARFSLVDKVETIDNKTYDIYLKNPEYKGNYTEEIIINKQNYISPFFNTKVKLNVKIVEKPNAKINVINQNKILITNVDENIIYRVSPSIKWLNSTSNMIEINKGHQFTVELRRVDPLTKVKSDILRLEVKLGLDPIAKEKNGEIVGVDETMEYKQKGEKYWHRITDKKLTNLKNGKYIIRRAQTQTTLPSNEITVSLTTAIE